MNVFQMNGRGEVRAGEVVKNLPIRHPNLTCLTCFSEALIYFHKSS